jgi:hypothetical protein
MSSPAHKPRKPRSKSQDKGPAPTTEKKGGVDKKTRSRSHDGSKKKDVSRSGAKRHPSAGSISLEAGLSKVAGPSLQRQDFGRNADDDDTFCGTEPPANKVNMNSMTTRDPFAMSRQAPIGRPNPFGGSAFGSRDDDSEEEEDIDFFAGVSSNPFKDLKKKSTPSRTHARTAL